MNSSDAIEMIRDAVGISAGVWADLGAGTGTFTRALTELLGTGSTVYAVDGDARAVRALRELSSSSSGDVSVTAVNADFTRPLELPGLAREAARLDGILLANALHFVPDAERVLSGLVKQLRPGGRVIVVEYDRRSKPVGALPDNGVALAATRGDGGPHGAEDHGDQTVVVLWNPLRRNGDAAHLR